jgi:hypothetical protein
VPDVTQESPLDHELDRMAGHPGLAKAVMANLAQLSRGVAGPDLAEMARDLMDGRIDIRTVARSSAYAEQITNATVTFEQWYSELSPEEREKLIADAEAHVAGFDEDA